MDQTQLRELESRCIQEEQPFCTAACPIHVDVRAFMAALAKDDVCEARKILDRTMPFPEIVGRLCDAPCRRACKRGEIGDPLAIGRLERFCVSRTGPMLKLPKLPAKGGRVAVLGAGLSGMTAALDLARKGRPTTLIAPDGEIGGRLRLLPESDVPGEALVQARKLLEGYGVAIVTGGPLGGAIGEFAARLAGEYDAVYCDLEDVEMAGIPDPLTLAVGGGNCFAGGGPGADSGFSTIKQVEDGRRAALSIERFLQKVSLTAQRDREGSCATRMATVIDRIPPAAEIRPTDPAGGYTPAEAVAEAGRCIQCECMECVKQCAYLREYKEYPKTLVRKIYNNLAIVQGTRSANKTINACSLCGQCTVICPHDFPVAELCRATRQEMVDTGHMPPSPHDFALEDMRFSLSEACRLSRHQPGHATSRFLFYPGCQLAGSSPELVTRTYEFLAEKLEGGVGLMLGCCGIPAHWAGQHALFTETLDALRAEVVRMGRPTVIAACSSCLAIFGEQAPELSVTSLWELLDGLELPAGQGPRPPAALALHDPCTARHRADLRASVRSLCAKLNLAVVEPGFGGALADCCGYGGLMQFANQPLGEKAAQVKAERSPGDGLAYCAMCRDNLAAAGRPMAHLLDYLFGQTGDPDPLARANPGFSGRHENRARLKERLLARLWQEEPMPRPAHAAMPLAMSPEIAALLDRRLILEEDVRKVIAHAESSGRYLIDPATGHRLASFRPVRVTYWIEYEPADAGYRIHNGYSHRMRLPEETP
ncbi:MAG: 4Fe-4S dicluster domain-containing protein [Desulfobulbus sp.]|jgi:Fe-S oxidoreductase|uniref:pyridine nucleotide-disulfide oxidoreductase/dicluster-binding protein n=1 Tax=Desulfobulbus sp. TaxID=895 RepID=UPI0028430472|nr:pyridine nucleotide-disulfide oxidoreductase/dicluster-binding protein [Desulfobulbus sp.]MDR2549058.1 4Fe-4S dicluster domain-containing protein [Desulfobulbus sp.]